MRLFLASQDLGDYSHILQQLVGEKRQALVISNARDYYKDEEKISKVTEKTLSNLESIGIKAERLDLKPYFNKQSELADLIEQKQPGLIFSIGGNVVCLATALHASGLDQIIKQGLANNQFVYGGYSAGSMITANDLTLYQLVPKPGETSPPHRVAEITYEIYDMPPYLHGLGIVPQYIVPHMNRADHIDAMQERLEKIRQAGAEPLCLNDPDVFVIDGESNQLLQGTNHEN